MIALVISIIVMLILAGVSISAIVGEDGILSKAKQASIASMKASILEELNMELTSYNIDTMLNSPEKTSEMLKGLKDKGLIDKVVSSSGPTTDMSSALGIPQFDDSNKYTGYTDYGVIKDDYSILLSVDVSGIYKASFGEVNVSAGGSVSAGTTVVTSNAFESGSGTEKPEDKGKFSIDDDASVMFVDEVDGELSIQVKSGTHAKVNVFKNMTLTNTGIKRSAIDIEPGGTLDLYIAEGATVTVNSGLGLGADSDNTPGLGGYAGIHVPGPTEDVNSDGYYTYEDITDTSGKYNCAVLNISGNGTLKAYGGNAGNGSLFGGKDAGGSGGGGAGAGIGGNGGKGGIGGTGRSGDGERGESCGIINIKNSISVYAYGGGAGSGAASNADNATSGGGYPASGIGGGGSGSGGGSCCAGGGGYCGGSSEGDPEFGLASGIPASKNGLSTYQPTVIKYSYWATPASSYYNTGLQKYDENYYPFSLEMNTDFSQLLGGMGGCGADTGHRAGTGGIAGSGGIIKVSNNCIVNSYNGNRYTDGTDYNNGMNQALIYAQQGIGVAQCDWQDNSGTVKVILVKPQREVAKTNYINPTMKTVKVTFNEEIPFLKNALMEKQGVGSGAGYIEISNGTYTVDESMN